MKAIANYIVAGGLLLLTSASVHAARLTGVYIFSCDPAGNPAGDFVWDTRGLDSDFYKVWLTTGLPGGAPDGLGTAFIHGPDWGSAPLDEMLIDGRHDFTFRCEFNGPWTHFAVNLFFDGSLTPDISVKAPVRTGVMVQRHKINTSKLTFSMTSYPNADAPAARSSRARIGRTHVSLESFEMAVPGLFASDRVDTHAATPSGRDDYVGSFTLDVSSGRP